MGTRTPDLGEAQMMCRSVFTPNEAPLDNQMLSTLAGKPSRPAGCGQHESDASSDMMSLVSGSLRHTLDEFGNTFPDPSRSRTLTVCANTLDISKQCLRSGEDISLITQFLS